MKPTNWRPLPNPEQKRDAEADLFAVRVHAAYLHGDDRDLSQGAALNMAKLVEESLPHWIRRAVEAEKRVATVERLARALTPEVLDAIKQHFPARWTDIATAIDDLNDLSGREEA